MKHRVRALTAQGTERFRRYLAMLRAGRAVTPPWELLDDAGCTSELPYEVWLEQRPFTNRLELGKFLCAQLAPLRGEDVDRNVGLWSWLSLFFFDQVCPARPDGTRRPGQDYRHVPDFTFRHRHRHLLHGPYSVYRRHGIRSILLLSGPLHAESGVYHEIASRLDLIANRGVVDAAMLLYFDPKRLAPKRGVQVRGAEGGTIRRFVRVLQQLDMTYDIYGMSGKEILELLPREFDGWRA